MPKIVNHNEYRKELLSKCFDLFARNGFQGVTIRELSCFLKVSTGTLYHYFSSKDEIFRQMILLLSHKQIVTLSERFTRTRSFDEKIQSIFQYISKNEIFFQNVLFLMIDYYRQNGLQDPENFIRDLANYYRKSLGDLLGIGDSPARGALFTFCLGLVVQTMLDSQGKEREEIFALIKQMIDSFIYSISTKVS